MSLEEIVNNITTDKNTIHSYLPLYERLLKGKKNTAKNVLEIGIYRGGSLKLWNDYFTNATVYGIDIDDKHIMENTIINNDKIKLIINNGYNDTFVTTEFVNNNIKFDFMLDDGPHTLDSMTQFIKLYSHLMTDDGILIIEDIQSWEWIDKLKNIVSIDLQPFIKTYDLRPNKHRYDDIVFTIDKYNV